MSLEGFSGSESAKPLSVSYCFQASSTQAYSAEGQGSSPPPVEKPTDPDAYDQAYFDVCRRNLPIENGQLIKDADLDNLKERFGVSNIRDFVPSGSRICIAVVPFGEEGNGLHPDQMYGRKQIVAFVIGADGVTMSGRLRYPSRDFDLLPTSVRKHCCTQPIVYGEDDNVDVAALIAAALEKPFKNAQMIFNRGSVIN